MTADAAGARGAAVELSGVTVRYGSTTALDGIDLSVAPGERVALLGPSGAGKSTVLALLTGRVRPDVGTVQVLGTPLVDAGERELRLLRRRISSMAQDLDLVGPLRVMHNVEAGRLGSRSAPRALWSLLRARPDPAVRAALDRVGLADRAAARTDTLSGGQRQRVALARLLVTEPDLVLADEPVSRLDPGLAVEVMELLSGLTARGPTSVTSLHDPRLARRYADRLVGLRDGRVVFDAVPSDVDDARLDELYRVRS